MSNRIKGIIDAVSDLAMDYSSRMARAKDQGFDFADGSSREGINYVNEAMRDGDPQSQAFSQYLSDNNIPYQPHVARTGSTYIDVLGDPYKLRDGGYSQSPLQYRFADHSKGKFGQKSHLGAKHIDSTMEADVFPGGNTLEQAIAKLEDTPGVRSRDAAFDPARRFDKNYLAGGAGLGILGGSMFASEDADAGILSRIKAFHGSPHDFDRFSSDNIGTGEGAQAYGHGLYFAEREGTAKSYRDALSADTSFKRSDGTLFDLYDGSMNHPNIRRHMAKTGGDLDSAIEKSQKIIEDNISSQSVDAATNDLSVLQKLKENGGITQNKGSMYEVNIDASPDELLDYDAPLSEQSDKVKEVAAFYNIKNSQSGMKEARGSDIYAAIASAENKPPFNNKRKIDGAVEASDALNKKGIKGIKYADAQTRFSPKGRTNNYVMFDDKTIEIARKYGVSMPVAGAILAGTITPEQAQASTKPEGNGLLDSIGDTALETMSGVNRAVADGVNFLTSDQINAVLNLSGSEKRIPDLYDIPGVKSGTKGNYMEPGLLRQIVRQGSEFLSPI